MRKKIMKALSVMLAVVLTFTAAPLSGFVGFDLPDWLDVSIMSKAEETVTSGLCGEYVSWEFDVQTGTLLFSGIGHMDMNGYGSELGSWEIYKNDIEKIVVESGVKISELPNCPNLVNITVDENNLYLSNDEYGVLFNKEKTTLIQYPIGDTRTSYAIPGSVTTIGDSAFEGSKNLEGVNIPDSVTSIGDDAFDGCSNLTSITIPDSVTSISSSAFYNCDSLTYITIPDSVTSIGYDAFYNTAYYNDSSNWENNVLYIGNHLIDADTSILGNYEIKVGTKTIAGSAFYNCRNLTSVTIPDSVTSISSSAFYNCDSLTYITIPDSVTSIGYDAFYNTAYYNDSSNWENNVLYIDNHLIAAKDDISGSYKIKEGTLTISGYAFYSCGNLTNIVIPDGVKSIGDSAFVWCDGLTSVTIPNSVTKISDFAFGLCGGLTSITIPDSVTSIGSSAFRGCTNLTNVTIGESVTVIGDRAFDNCRSLTSVTIPDSVTTIGDGAFLFCDNLTSVTIGSDVTRIDDVFTACSRLESITVDNNNQYFSNDGYGVLFNKDKTTLIQYPSGNVRESYTIPDSVILIGDRAFDDCYRLTSVTIPNSTTIIGDYAFEDCYNLTNITIPNSVKLICGMAFGGCSSLTNTIIPDSVTVIGAFAFFNCASLTNITIPDSVTKIGFNAFYWCNSLISVAIGKNVSRIDESTFADCESLASFIVDGSNQYYSSDEYGVLFNKDKTTLIQYPEGNIKTSYTIPNSVISIGSHAFSDCINLTSITIPNSVKKISRYAFFYCTNLTDVYFLGTETEWNNIKIDNIYDSNEPLLDATIHFISHTHSYITVVTKPTCTTGGYTTYTCSACGNTYKADEVSALGHLFENGACTVCGTNDPSYTEESEYNYTFSIQTPSRTEIRNKDGIILHANFEGTAPNGSYVRWESSNGNFDTSADGSNLKIIAKNKGYTTFTAILCDADGNELARDTVEMYSKSGFFDKIGGFFRGLFGLTKIYDN